jgi:hypothetical protein
MSTVEHSGLAAPAEEHSDRPDVRLAPALPPIHEREQLYFALRAIAVLNVVCIALMWRARTLIDYGCFYAVGRLALSSRELVYSAAAQRAEQLRLFPGQGGWIAFYHPPFELAIFAPLARLPYALSHALWMAIGAGALLISTRLLSSVFAISWRQQVLLSLALFPTFGAFYAGQDTFLLLLAVSAAIYFAQRHQDALAGIVLAAGCFKPQIPLVIAVALLLHGRRKLFTSFCATAGLLGLASLAYLGKTGLRQMLSMLRVQESMDDIWRMPSLRGLLSLVHAPDIVAIVLSIVLLTYFSMRWYRSEPNLLSAFSFAIPVGSLVAFHFHGYDLSLLLIPVTYFLLTDRSRVRLAAILAIAASPVFILFLAMKASALLALPVLVLALCPEMPAALPSRGCSQPE